MYEIEESVDLVWGEECVILIVLKNVRASRLAREIYRERCGGERGDWGGTEKEI